MFTPNAPNDNYYYYQLEMIKHFRGRLLEISIMKVAKLGLE